MKRLLITLLGVIALVLVIFFGFFKGSTTNFVNELPEVITEVIEVEVEKPVPADELRIKAAQDAARAEIEAKAQKAFDDTFTNEMNKVEAEVLRVIEEETRSRREAVENEIIAY